MLEAWDPRQHAELQPPRHPASALLTLDLRVAGGPFGDGVQAPCARLYLVENGKITAEQVVFYVDQG